jgi:hypothetical protein
VGANGCLDCFAHVIQANPKRMRGMMNHRLRYLLFNTGFCSNKSKLLTESSLVVKQMCTDLNPRPQHPRTGHITLICRKVRAWGCKELIVSTSRLDCEPKRLKHLLSAYMLLQESHKPRGHESLHSMVPANLRIKRPSWY